MRSALLLVASLPTVLGTACRSAEGDAAAAPATSMIQSPVLVELFTSQGCSSCPPAEALLPQLRSALPGVTVLPLAYHVDYWDGLGWRDPFSSADWTARQRRYAQVLDGEVYTPQLVVQGASHVIGSNRGDAVDAIRAAARRAPEGRIRASVTSRGPIEVEVEAELLETSSRARAEVWIALSESGLATVVSRGENRGRALHSDLIVRRLERAFSLDKGVARRATVSLMPASDWKRDKLDITVLIQDPDSRRILAAAAAAPR